MIKPAALLALIVFAGFGCASAEKKGEAGLLIVTVKPAEITYGISAEVIVVAADGSELKWAKGTVDFPGRVPDVSLKAQENSKALSRRFPAIPRIIQVKPGEYNVRVWGETHSGKEYKGSTQVLFK